MSLSRLKSASGFTLIEIIAVMAVLGLLAGLTVPKFMRMVNKANQKGAVVLLTAGYMAEKNFVVENGAYTTCLRNIGMARPGGPIWYTVGINGLGVNASCGSTTDQACNSTAYDDGASVATCAQATCPTTGAPNGDTVCADRVQSTSGPAIPGPPQLATQPTDVTNTSFTIRAVGNVASESNFDRWTIDHLGTPTNTNPNF